MDFHIFILSVLDLVGSPYWWGKGDASKLGYVARGYDCSGFVCAVLHRCGVLARGDYGASALFDMSDPVSVPQLGDLVFWDAGGGVCHVGFFLHRDAAGRILTVSANGSGSSVRGDNPDAHVMVRWDYWASARVAGFRRCRLQTFTPAERAEWSKWAPASMGPFVSSWSRVSAAAADVLPLFLGGGR